MFFFSVRLGSRAVHCIPLPLFYVSFSLLILSLHFFFFFFVHMPYISFVSLFSSFFFSSSFFSSPPFFCNFKLTFRFLKEFTPEGRKLVARHVVVVSVLPITILPFYFILSFFFF
ncbi:hypothetical protein, unlikely [Trypanosoma brucei gambiense DAL972]|uniref:Uncharacterized protein n=1 Tax=Trypanosoma brucei gambiense (strain MHOM/CI/86/DAL972) TaxID=679716 RepID=C9ZYF1_TRYB9|nr:hypothetical protein, unlikely [Trypanosoma brucei gambiense DAL972]CBH14450.1 hypothetical protein, unlikely [Trypanosoma brucei gambiense DAL972]|eukprot:XP_011776716.1 hypothetical protein, unlikely [Trypanosoma brucei gambiense DAL972]